MKLLILGGTIFVGRHLVEVALERGHEVTLFNRGQHNPELFPDVEKLHGDRDGNLQALAGRRWDAVIDVNGYLPRLVRASAEFLANAVEHYTFISTISVYAGLDKPNADENAPLGVLEDPTIETITGETYGPLKVLCEQAVEAALPGRVLVVRPGLVVGPYDHSDRFTYWPRRVAQGGEILAPGRFERRIQLIDARDLAQWTIRMVEGSMTGVYHATGPDVDLTMGMLLEACKDVIDSDAVLTWVDEQFLLDAGAGPWIELPLWIPENDPESAGQMSLSVAKATTEGLSFRPITTTIRDTLAWDQTRPDDVERRAGLTPEREQELLRMWHAREQSA